MYVLITVTLRIFFFVCERVNHPSFFFSFFLYFFLIQLILIISIIIRVRLRTDNALGIVFAIQQMLYLA